MLLRRKSNIYLVSVVSLLLFFCSKSEKYPESYKQVFNTEPRYKDKEFVKLKLLHSIEMFSSEYTVSVVSDMDADSDNNLYVPAQYDGTITVFDHNGKYMKTLGQRGQGPRDLYAPRLVSIHDNKLHIIEGFNGLKIWNLQGDYIDKIFIRNIGYEFFKATNDFYYFMYFRVGMDRNTWTYTLSEFSKDFEHEKEIFSCLKDHAKEFKFEPEYVIAFTSDNQFYFPENIDTYSIMKYDPSGSPVLNVQRKYERIPYSRKARESFHNKFGDAVADGELSELSKYPPVVRKILIDSSDNMFVVSGEMNIDLGDDLMSVEVDIFDQNGIWLYNFQSVDISRKSFIKNDRLYSVSKISPDTGQQYINVFEIQYNY